MSNAPLWQAMTDAAWSRARAASFKQKARTTGPGFYLENALRAPGS
jgi:hypothetical protein